MVGLKTNNILDKIVFRQDIPNYDTYNITVANYHTYLANDIVAHNIAVKPTTMRTGGFVGKFSDANSIMSGDTGLYVPSTRYTGEWGNEGKLAILHEKELVLNREDTANMLQMVKMTRDISQRINLQTALTKMTQATLDYGTSISSISNKSYADNGVNQQIHIDANFPNVSVKAEIEAAFDELALRATQYVNQYNY